jgi:hypothetical protein
LLEYHVHLHQLARREAKFPLYLEIDILFRGGVLDNKISSFNPFRGMAYLFEVDLEN